MSFATRMLAQVDPGILLLAQDEDLGASYGVVWLLVLLAVILGVMPALRPDKREAELKRSRP